MHKKSTVLKLIRTLDLGSSIAESDDLLETSRVETSVFADLLNDKVDLVPGTKGSGKSALFRIFVDFLPQLLLDRNKVVVAHGVEKQGDSVFHAFKDDFDKLSEDEFVSFWCIYLVSLAHEQFIKGTLYKQYLNTASVEVENFKRACSRAKIPEIRAKKSLSEILAWTFTVLKGIRPKLTYKPPGEAGEFGVDLFGNLKENQSSPTEEADNVLPKYISDIKNSLE